VGSCVYCNSHCLWHELHALTAVPRSTRPSILHGTLQRPKTHAHTNTPKHRHTCTSNDKDFPRLADCPCKISFFTHSESMHSLSQAETLLILLPIKPRRQIFIRHPICPTLSVNHSKLTVTLCLTKIESTGL